MIPNKETYDSVSTIVNDFLNKEQRSLLSFSLILTLFYSSEGMMGLMRYFDRDQKVYVVRNIFQRRWAAVKLTIMLMGVVILSIVAIIIQTKTVNELLLQIFDNLLLIKIFSLLVLYFIIFSAISCIYIYGPSLTHRFKFISAGAVFASIICVLSSTLFFYVVNHFLDYNKVYGSIGTLIAFFVWMSINTRIIMLGYDLNVSILMGRIHKKSITDSAQ
jgi:membrane protein